MGIYEQAWAKAFGKMGIRVSFLSMASSLVEICLFLLPKVLSFWAYSGEDR